MIRSMTTSVRDLKGARENAVRPEPYRRRFQQLTQDRLIPGNPNKAKFSQASIIGRGIWKRKSQTCSV